jgi:hypothetical protein
MNLTKMIAELREQKEALEQTMLMLERLARTQGTRRGRPPLFLSQPSGGNPARKRRPFSAETRKKMAASQRKRWAAIRKKEGS